MKIWGEIPKILGVYDKRRNVDRVERTSAINAKKDIVSISGQAKDYQIVMKALKDVPDVRQEKIDKITEKFNSGDYGVNGRVVADKLVKSVFDKKV